MELTVLRPNGRLMPIIFSIFFLAIAIFLPFYPLTLEETPFDKGEFTEISGTVKAVTYDENQDNNWWIYLNDGSAYNLLGLAQDALNYEELDSLLPINAQVTLTLSRTTTPEYQVIAIQYGETAIISLSEILLRDANNSILANSLLYTLSAICLIFAVINIIQLFLTPKKMPQSLYETVARASIYYDKEIKDHCEIVKKRTKRKHIFTLYIPAVITAFCLFIAMAFSSRPTPEFIAILVFITVLICLIESFIIAANNLSRARRELEYFCGYYTYDISNMNETTSNSFINIYNGKECSFTPDGLQFPGDNLIPYEELHLDTRIFFRGNENMINILLTTDCPEEPEENGEPIDTGKELIFFLNIDLFYWLKFYNIEINGLDETLKNIKKLAREHINLKLQLRTMFGLFY